MSSQKTTYNEFEEGNIIISKKQKNNENNKILGIVNKKSNKTNSQVVVRVKNLDSFFSQKKRYNKGQVEKKKTFESYNEDNVVVKKKNGKILGVVNKLSNDKNSKVVVRVKNPYSSFLNQKTTYNKIYVEKKENYDKKKAKYESYKKNEIVFFSSKNGKINGIVEKNSNSKDSIVYIIITDKYGKTRTVIKDKKNISKKLPSNNTNQLTPIN